MRTTVGCGTPHDWTKPPTPRSPERTVTPPQETGWPRETTLTRPLPVLGVTVRLATVKDDFRISSISLQAPSMTTPATFLRLTVSAARPPNVDTSAPPM